MTVLLRLLVLVWWGSRWSSRGERIGCRPTEFRCSSGQCVDGGRYCDGNDDCFDASDEPDRCTNCNRTFFGVLDVKYPLRLSERRSPTCTLSFVAAGGRHGDTVEITFLSFQIGTFDFDSSTCLKGYLEMEESSPPATPETTRGRRRTKKKPPRRKGASLRAPSGSFCGPLIGPSATFYSSGERVRLTVFVPPAAGQPIVPRLYLTYRFLRRAAAEHSCDRTLTDCGGTDCVIRSPNFPGFYLRNISCHYWIREESSAQIEIFQDNEFKIKIPSGHTNSDRYKPGALTSDCAADTLRIYDGQTTQAPLLAEFCGAGPLPPVRSSGPHLLVKLTSVPFQTLSTAHFELSVRVVRSPRAQEGCSVTIDGSRHPSGVLRTPDHAVPASTVCTYRVTARRPTDRVWLYFASFHVPDANPWSEVERCDVAKMEVVVVHPKRRHHHHHQHEGVETFCEKTSPRQCGHASDFADLVPERPCTLPEESYLSQGPEIQLRMTYLSSTVIRGSSPHFSARYEVVEGGSDPSCFFIISSRDGKKGVLESPKNVFLFGRGGSRDLRCRYELRGASHERVSFSIEEVTSPPQRACVTQFDSVTQRPICGSSGVSSAILNASEVWQGARVFVGCACGVTAGGAVAMASVGAAVDVEFSVRDMDPRDDFHTFGFRMTYEFVPRSECGDDRDVMSGSKGSVVLRGGGRGPLRCRWLLAAFPARALYVTVNGRTFDDDAECRNKILFYSINSREPYSVFCPSADGHQESFYTESWRPGRPPYEPDLTLLEYLIDEDPSTPLQVTWIEVTRSSDPCPLECPELEACIAEDLACDGVRHCPASGRDEAPERCSQTPFLAVVVTSSAAAAVAMVTLVAMAALLRHRAQDKSAVPPAYRGSEPRSKVPVVR